MIQILELAGRVFIVIAIMCREEKGKMGQAWINIVAEVESKK